MSVPRFCCICLWPGSKLERELRVVRRGSIQPEFARQIARADVFTCCNDGGGKARADLAGFHHGLAVGLADDRPGKERVARAMAEGVRAVTGADYGISVTGVAGPDSDERGNAVGTVYIGLAGPDGTLCRLRHFGKRSRERIRGQSANTAFDLLRRELQK